MENIHSTAIISPQATLGNDVQIGPFCVIESDSQIGHGCKLESHVIVKSGTSLGADNWICEGTVLGGKPQHLQATENLGRLVIGQGNSIRENVTIHRGLTDGEDTTIGDKNFLMVGSHIGHDCHVGNHTIIANNVMLSGHVTIQDRACLSGAAGVHQFCRIGAYTMVGGQARITKDVPPYVTVDGESNRIVGLNLIGLKRNGFQQEDILQLKSAYRIIYRHGLKWSEVLCELKNEFSQGPATALYEFLCQGQRGFVCERRVPRTATLKLHKEEIIQQQPAAVRRAG